MAIDADKVIWVFPCFGYPRTQNTSDMGIPAVSYTPKNDPASEDKTGENEVIWEILQSIYLLIRVLC